MKKKTLFTFGTWEMEYGTTYYFYADTHEQAVKLVTELKKSSIKAAELMPQLKRMLSLSMWKYDIEHKKIELKIDELRREYWDLFHDNNIMTRNCDTAIEFRKLWKVFQSFDSDRRAELAPRNKWISELYGRHEGLARDEELQSLSLTECIESIESIEMNVLF